MNIGLGQLMLVLVTKVSLAYVTNAVLVPRNDAVAEIPEVKHSVFHCQLHCY